MSEWVTFLVDARPITAIFGDDLPSGHALAVHDLVMSREGPSVAIRFDVPVFPVNPPAKWVASGFNRIQIQLLATGVHELSVNGLHTDIIADLSVCEEESRMRIRLLGDNFSATLLADALIIQKISAYKMSAGIG